MARDSLSFCLGVGTDFSGEIGGGKVDWFVCSVETSYRLLQKKKKPLFPFPVTYDFISSYLLISNLHELFPFIYFCTASQCPLLKRPGDVSRRGPSYFVCVQVTPRLITLRLIRCALYLFICIMFSEKKGLLRDVFTANKSYDAYAATMNSRILCHSV